MTVVALIDGDERARSRAARTLRSAALDVIESTNGLDALRQVFTARPDAAVVDLSADGIDGYELIRVLRAACDFPIVACAEGLTSDQIVKSLTAGADDAVEKTCTPVEMIARVRAAVRRHERRMAESDGTAREVATGALVIDRVARAVWKHGARVKFTRTEYRLLDALASRVGQVCSHRSLLTAVWGDEYVDESHYLRVYVGYLRGKIEDEPSLPRYIVNEWGAGYRLAMLPLIAAPIPGIRVADQALIPTTVAGGPPETSDAVR